uniref:Mammalian ependymin-related protein 1 n=1 Tax=Labrus bergylta TaxID=56723 RepID=A0A3Q3FGI7_9LABR
SYSLIPSGLHLCTSVPGFCCHSSPCYQVLFCLFWPEEDIQRCHSFIFLFLGSRFFEYIFLYQSLVMFQIDQKTKDCSKIALTEAWDPFDIPVQEWSDRKPARQHETWVGVYTLKDCYPVQETYVRNSSVTTSTRFFNLQLGISDPDVFTPPSTCQSARPERMSESGC